MESIRLLLVDDESNFRQAVARRLKKRGYAPSQADGGCACLDLLEREPMDVVILDVKMPGMNGIDVLGRIKAGIPIPKSSC